ncbi:MAG: 2-isopropylmalate synthase, partial [Patescibacteria group bacterium]
MRTFRRKQQWNALLRIIIFDTTLRDGEQCPGAAMNLREKLEVARQLARLKVDVIEAGFPVISDGDFAAVHAIAKEIKGPVICALARCVPKDIDAASRAIKPAGKRGRIHVFVGTSRTHGETLKKSQGQVLHLAVEGVRRAKRYVTDVEFSAMDATRTDREFLVTVCKAAIAAGATTVNIPDTVGIALPEEMTELIIFLRNEIPEFRNGAVTLSVHCHNDLGLAVANSLAAIKAGATQIECTVNGIGERAGNAALEEVVMAVKTRRERFVGYGTNINTLEIVRSSQLVARLSGLVVQRSKAIVGGNAFAHASGIHQDGVLKMRSAFEIMKPKEVGWRGEKLPLTKHSGRAAVSVRLKYLGFKMTDADVNAIFNRFKEIGDKKKFVYDDDLVALVEGCVNEVPEIWALRHLQISSGTKQVPTAVVQLENGSGLVQDASTGDGPIDAVFKAIYRLTR